MNRDNSITCSAFHINIDINTPQNQREYTYSISNSSTTPKLILLWHLSSRSFARLERDRYTPPPLKQASTLQKRTKLGVKRDPCTRV